jgi:hypothetical protein
MESPVVFVFTAGKMKADFQLMQNYPREGLGQTLAIP